MKIAIIGGGILGTTHALAAVAAGFHVIQFERDDEARSASVRNFGLIWVSGRSSGPEWEISLRARQLWDELHRRIPEMIFRPEGSLTLAVNEAEEAVMHQCLSKSDAEARQWRILSKAETQEINPALKGNYLSSLYCPLDAIVEPGSVLHSMRKFLSTQKKYTWRNKSDVAAVQDLNNHVLLTLRDGEEIACDKVILCAGADHGSLFKEHFDAAPLRKVRIQMMRTAPFEKKLTTSVADGDSMRYYPAYQVPTLDGLPPQPPIAHEKHMQLLMVQRIDGTLTIGDTHEYEEPFDFALDERPYTYLHQLASALVGVQLPEITHRWSGVYSQRSDGAICDRRAISANITSITGPGGRGNTLAPALAEETIQELITGVRK